jgi:hypothetical protein
LSEATITADLKSDEYLKVVDAHIEKFLKGNLIPQALKNVANDIYAGNIGTSKWLLELTCKYFAQNRAGITLNLGLFTDFQGRLVTAVAARIVGENGNGHYDGNGNGNEDGSPTDIKQLVVYNPADPGTENPDLESGSVG